jgi:hypothetical protein
MPFPSDAIRIWCENIERLRAEQERTRHAREDGFCQCPDEIGIAISLAPRDQQAQLCSGLFWSIWIDQVIYAVSRVGPGFYPLFRHVYRFPRLYGHPVGLQGYASPACLIEPPGNTCDDRWRFERPNPELLLEDKREFWGEVAAWLSDVCAGEVREAAEEEFRRDIRERFQPGFEFLFSE